MRKTGFVFANTISDLSIGRAIQVHFTSTSVSNNESLGACHVQGF